MAGNVEDNLLNNICRFNEVNVIYRNAISTLKKKLMVEKKVHTVSDASLNKPDAQVFANVIAQVVEAIGADVIVFSNNTSGKALAPRLSVRLKAGLVSGAIALPDLSNGFIVKKTIAVSHNVGVPLSHTR